MIDVEEIDDNSSQEGNLAPPTLTLAKMKRAKTKTNKDSPAVAPPSSTLTPFLGPASPTSRPDWDNVNLVCCVCQQTGFSRLTLKLHVNHCLENPGRRGQPVASDGKNAAAGESDAAGRVGNADVPKSAQRATYKVAKVAGGDSREGKARQGPRGSASKIKAVDHNGGEQQLCQDKAANEPKTQQGRRAVDIENPGSTLSKTAVRQSDSWSRAPQNTMPDATPRQPRLPDSTQSALASTTQQPTSHRRRGLGLARPRGHQAGSDVSPMPAATASRVLKDCDGRAVDKIARAQLLYLLEASAGGTAQGGGWIGTQLFPKLDLEDIPADDRSVDYCCLGTDGVCRESCGADACGAIGNQSRRVRARPASWGARPSGEQRGWLGIWPVGVGDGNDDDEDCWGDGDGYLTLRPFPSPETLAESNHVEDKGDGVGARAGDAQEVRAAGQGAPAPSSRADRFLQVFSRLQPARRTLNLHESPPPSPQVVDCNPAHAQGEGGGERPPTRVSAPNGTQCASSSGSQHAADSQTKSSAAELGVGGAGAGTEARTIAEHSCEGESVSELDTPLPKRTALRAISEVSARNSNQRPSATTSLVQSASPGVTISFEAGSGHKVSREQQRTEPPENRRRLAQRIDGEEPRRREQLDRIGTNVGGWGKSGALPTLTVRPTSISNVQDSSGVGNVTHHACRRSQNSPKVVETSVKQIPLANKAPAVTAASRSAGLEVASTTSMPETQPPPAILVENATTVEHQKPTAAVDRPRLNEAVRGVPQLTPGDGNTANSGRKRRAGTPVVVKRIPDSHGTSTGASAMNADRHSQSARDPQPGMKRAAPAPVSDQWRGSRSRGALACRASSGLLRSADLAANSGNQHTENGGEQAAPAASKSDELVDLVDLADSDASQQEECHGHRADVSQKGSLTVVWDHGATLRSSWSIDSSQELGKLAFGMSLDYDAVWYLSPADADCVSVLRYRIVPHPRLAPSGGWISGTGRLRDDPYTIVKIEASAQHSHRHPDSHHHGEAGIAGLTKPAYLTGGGNSKLAAPSRGHGGRSQERRGGSGRHAERYERWGASHSDRSSAGLAGGGGPRKQPHEASRVLPKVVSGRGSFGLATSPSAEALEADDSRDKVTCPKCKRGMDHWTPELRQQHVHACLLRPSSAKKTPSAANATPNASRPPGIITNRLSLQQERSGGSVQPTPRSSRRTEQRGLGPGGMEGRNLLAKRQELPDPDPDPDPDPAESPRTPRVSLQGMFSPKPARLIRHQQDEDENGPKSVSVSASQSRGTAQDHTVGVGVVHVVAKSGRRTTASLICGLAECPVCGLDFGGRQGQWERQAHIQQCLECLDSAWQE